MQSTETIDLVSPTKAAATPAHAPDHQAPDDDEFEMSSEPWSARKRKATGEAQDGAGAESEADDDADDDLEMLDAPHADDDTAAQAGGAGTSGAAPAPMAALAATDEEEDIEYVGRKGSLALEDYPHAR